MSDRLNFADRLRMSNEIIRLEVENYKLRDLIRKLVWGYDHDLPPAGALIWWNEVRTQLRDLGIEEG